MNYYNTLIQVADDCPVIEAQVPPARAAQKSKARVEYELLVEDPYRYTEADISLEVTRLQPLDEHGQVEDHECQLDCAGRRAGVFWVVLNGMNRKVHITELAAPKIAMAFLSCRFQTP
jgi:hypothetical protein